MLHTTLALALLFGASPTTRLAMVPLVAGNEVNEKTAAAITEAAGNEVRRVPGVQLITQQELNTMLGFEKQRQMLAGCAGDDCMAQFGGALGVEKLVTGSLAKVGESWLFTLKILDVKKAKTVGQSDRRLRKGTLDDVLDQLPKMVGELFGAQPVPGPITDPVKAGDPAKGGPAQADASKAPDLAKPGQAVAPQRFPSPAVEVPMDPQPKLDDLNVGTDGKGLYVVIPKVFDSERLFVGDGKTFFHQRVRGGGSDGEGKISLSFWEPRIRKNSEVVRKPKTIELWCGEEMQELTKLSKADAQKLLQKAKFMKRRWTRAAVAYARDDLGNYVVVDQALEPKENSDYRLYFGSKGMMGGYEVLDRIDDPSAVIYITKIGRLKLLKVGRGEPLAGEWITPSKAVPLSVSEPADVAQLIYRDLGIYAGERLGTPCDPKFK